MTQHSPQDPFDPRPPATPAQKLTNLYATDTSAGPGPKRGGSPVGAKTGIVVVLLAAGAWLASHFGYLPGGGQGAGTGPTAPPPTTQPVVAAAPSRPLEVMIEGENYLVDGKEMPLDGVIALAKKVPDGNGPQVSIKGQPTARAKKDVDLTRALKGSKITYYLAPPLSED